MKGLSYKTLEDHRRAGRHAHELVRHLKEAGIAAVIAEPGETDYYTIASREEVEGWGDYPLFTIGQDEPTGRLYAREVGVGGRQQCYEGKNGEGMNWAALVENATRMVEDRRRGVSLSVSVAKAQEIAREGRRLANQHQTYIRLEAGTIVDEAGRHQPAVGLEFMVPAEKMHGVLAAIYKALGEEV